MLNIKIVFILFLIGFSKKSFSQEFRTYITDFIPYHTLILKNDTLFINIPKKNITSFGSSIKFLTKKKEGTIYILDKLIYKNKKGGIILPNLFANQFINKKINKKSDNELIINNKPYFKKDFVFELIGDNKIYYINGKLFKIHNNSNEIDLNKVLKKPKRAKLKILNGLQGYEKYGIIGLNGVIEISDKKKRCN